MKPSILFHVVLVWCFQHFSPAQVTYKTVIQTVDLAKETKSMSTLWACLGYDETNYTYVRHKEKLLSEIEKISSKSYNHNTL